MKRSSPSSPSTVLEQSPLGRADVGDDHALAARLDRVGDERGQCRYGVAQKITSASATASASDSGGA